MRGTKNVSLHNWPADCVIAISEVVAPRNRARMISISRLFDTAEGKTAEVYIEGIYSLVNYRVLSSMVILEKINDKRLRYAVQTLIEEPKSRRHTSHKTNACWTISRPLRCEHEDNLTEIFRVLEQT